MNPDTFNFRHRAALAAGLRLTGPAARLCAFGGGGGGSSSSSTSTAQTSTNEQLGASDNAFAVKGSGNTLLRDSGNTTNVDASNRSTTNTTVDTSNRSTNTTDRHDTTTTNVDASVRNDSHNTTTDLGAIAAGTDISAKALELARGVTGEATAANTGLAEKIVDANGSLTREVLDRQAAFMATTQADAQNGTAATLERFQDFAKNAQTGGQSDLMKYFLAAFAVLGAVLIFRRS